MLRATAPGDLLTYGQVAVLAGHIGGARAVGHVLVPGHELRQAELLAREGIEVGDGRCQMRRTA